MAVYGDRIKKYTIPRVEVVKPVEPKKVAADEAATEKPKKGSKKD